MDTDTQIKILNNQATQNVTSDAVIEINKKKDILDYSPEEYYTNKDLYNEAEKSGKVNLPLLGYDVLKGTAKSLADSQYYAVYRDYLSEMQEKEQSLAQADFENSSWWNRTATAYKTSSLSLERSDLYKKLMDARENEDYANEQGYLYAIDKIDKELTKYPQASEPDIASGVGSLTASMVDFAPSLVGEAAVAAGLAGVTYLTGGAASGATVPLATARVASVASKLKRMYDLSRGAIQGALVYNHTTDLEAGSTYAELDKNYPNMSEDRKREIAMTAGRLKGFVEASGWSFGTFPLLKGLTNGLAGKLATGAISPQVVNSPAFKQIITRKVGELARAGLINAGSEAGEELVQNAIDSTVEEVAAQGDNVSAADITAGALGRLGASAINAVDYLSEGTPLTEETIQNLNTLYSVGGASALLSGIGIGGRVGVDTYSHFRTQAKAKNLAQRLAEGDTNLQKAESYMDNKRNSEVYKKAPEAYNRHTANMVAEGTAPEMVTFDADVAVQLMEEAQNDQNLAAQVALLDLPAKIEEAQKTDGTIRVKFEDADQIIFNPENDVLFQKIKNNLSFDEETMSEAGARVFAESLFKQNQQLADRVNQTDSLMRDAYNQLRQIMPEDKALANAAVLQNAINSMRTFGANTVSEEELLRNIGLQLRIANAQRTPKVAPTKSVLKGERVGGTKVKTRSVPLSKVSVDQTLGVDVPFVQSAAEGAVMFEDNQGNLIPVTAQEQIASAKNAGRDKLRAVVVREKDGYTIDDAIDVAQQSQGDVLFQNVDEITAGYFDARDAANQILALTEQSNPTTFTHEVFHLFFENMLNQYAKGDLRPYWQQQIKKAAEWSGAELVNGKYVFNTEQKEKIADGFSDYLMKGKAPATRLQVLFDAFRDLFIKVYAILRRTPMRLNKNITDVYDSMFLSYGEAIDLQTQERYGVMPKPEGENDELYEDYISLVRESARQSSTTAADAVEMIKDKRNTDAYKQKFQQYYDEFLPQVKEDRFQQAYAYVAENKVNSNLLRDMGLSLRRDMVSATGKDPNAVAQEYGFDNAADLVDYLNVGRPAEEVAMEAAEESADEWLKKEYPELTQVDAKNATRNLATIKAQIQEAMMLRGISLGDFTYHFNEMVRQTEQVIQNSKTPDITNVEKLLARLNLITEKYRVAENNGDKLAMSKLRYRSAVLNYMVMRGNMIRKDIKKFDRHFKRYKKRPTSFQLKTIEGRVWDMITGVLNKFNYTAKKPANPTNITQRITEYADELASQGFGMPDTLKSSAVFLDNRDNIQPKDMKISDFYTLNGALRLLESVSKKNTWLDKNELEMTYQEMALSTVKHLADMKYKPKDKDTIWTKYILNFSVLPEIFLEKVLPAPVFENLVLPFMDAFPRSRNWVDEKTKQLLSIIEPITKLDKQTYTIDGRTYTGEQLSAIVLHLGNSHNRACITKTLENKFGRFTEEDLVSLQNQIPKVYRSYAQAIWDSFEENAEEFRKAQQRLTGAEIKMVESEQVVFDDGEVLRGGYYPASKKNIGGNKDFEDSTTFTTNGVFPTYGFQHERTVQAHGELDLSLKPLQAYVEKMANVLFIGEHYNRLQKFINRPEMINALGEVATKGLNDWMTLTIKPEGVNRLIGWWDNLSSVAILGFSPIKSVVQMCGLIPSMGRVGAENIIPSFLRNINPYNLVRMHRTIKQKSAYMKSRFENPENHIADVRKFAALSLGTADKTLQQVSHIGMVFIEIGDKFASIVTWDAEYNRALREGKSERTAILLADEAVRTTQGDSSSGSRPRLLQGDARFFTKFASYFIAVHSRVAADAFTGNWYGAIRTLVLAGIISASMEVLAGGWFKWWSMDNDEKRKKYKNSFEKYMKSQAFENSLVSTASSLVPHFGLGSNLSTYILSGKEYAPTIQALTKMIDTAKIPLDLAKIPLTKEGREREKAMKRLWKHLFAPLPIKENRAMDLYNYIKEI